ncbi:MAG: double zinc ribbon domain-containing protein [Patescibacteria group bacterium]
MWNTFLKIIYPYFCLLCKKELNDSYLCRECFSTIPLLKEQLCPLCEKPSLFGKTHENCRKKTPLSGAFVAMDYKEKIVQQLIHQYKYKFVKDLAEPLSDILIKSLAEQNKELFFNIDTIITAVPLHPIRLRWRGFNQAQIIAQKLASHFNLPYENLLIRSKNNLAQKDMPQTSLRQKNIQGVFRLNTISDTKYRIEKRAEIKPNFQKSSIIIVDDITTTLSTLNECATTLLPLKPKNIYAIVLARGL